MEEKCQKYEYLFVAGNEKELLAHLSECPECKKEHEKMCRVSELVKEAKPYFKRQKRKNAALKAVCASFLLVFTFAGFSYYGNYQNTLISQETTSSYEYFHESSFISEMGFPVDEYGLLMVD